MAALRRRVTVDPLSSSALHSTRACSDARARFALAAAAFLPMLSTSLVHADLYWDVNGTTANTGNSATGTWSSSTANWNTGSTGTGGAAVTWTPGGDKAIFSSGTGHTGTTNVTIVGTQTVTGIVFEEGNVFLTGPGALSIGSSPITIQTTHTGNSPGNILVPIIGSGDITISNTSGGDATINIDGDMTGFTGAITVGAGTSATRLTKLQLDGPLGDPTKAITLNNFAELSNNNQVSLPTGGTTSNNYTIANPIVLAGDNGWLASANGPTGLEKIVTYGGQITGNATSNLWIGIGNGGGRGAVVLGTTATPQYTYGGDTYIVMANNNGLVQVGADNILPATTNLTFGSQTGGSGAVAPLDLNGHSLTVASLASSTTGAVPGIFNTVNTPVTLTVNGAKSTSFKGVIGNTGINLNPFNNNAPYVNNTSAYPNVSLVKNGTESLTVTSAGNGLGAVNVNGGVLAFTNTAAAAGGAADASGGFTIGSVNAGNPATLAGGRNDANFNGVSLYGHVTVNANGVIAPGGVGAAGTLNILGDGNVDFNDGSRLVIDYASPGSVDKLVAANNINFDAGTHTIDVNLASGATANLIAPGTYRIGEASAGNINVAGGTGFTVGTTPGGNFNYDVFVDPDGFHLNLKITSTSLTYRWSVDSANPVVEGGGTWAEGGGNFINDATGDPVVWSNAGAQDVVIGGDTFQAGGDISLGSDITLNGRTILANVAADSPYTIRGDGHTLTFASDSGLLATNRATIDAPVALAVAQPWIVTGGASVVLTVSQAISGQSLTKFGDGVLLLAAPGGNLAGVTVSQGTLAIGAASAVGSTAISLNSGGRLAVVNATNFSNDVNIDSTGGAIGTNASDSGTLSGKITAAAGGAVSKFGAGLLMLANPGNQFNGNTLTIAGGVGSAIAIASPAALTGANLTLANGGLTFTAPVTLPNDILLSGRVDGNIIDLTSADSTLAGVISGDGNIYKTGSGTLTLKGVSTWTGGAFTVRTPSTVVFNSASPVGSATIAIDAPVTYNVPVDANTAAWRSIAADFHKTGAGTLTVGATGAAIPTNNIPGFAAVIDEGAIRMNTPIALGGNANADQMNLVVNAGATLIANYNGERLGGSITLNAGGTLLYPAGAPAGEATLLSSYTQTNAAGVITSTNHNNSLAVTGNATIRSQFVSTSSASQILVFTGPVTVNSGATLTVANDNTGGYDASNIVAFRGATDYTADPDATHANAAFPNDAITVQGGATLVTQGPGQVRFGRVNSQGKPIVGLGTPGSESVLRLSANTFLEDLPTNPPVLNVISRLVVAGSGSAGLRVEAPMNATYTDRALDIDPTHPDGTTGLFGVNATGTAAAAVNGFSRMGNAFTVLSPNRADQLSLPFGSPALTLGGTLTLAANDPAGATGAVGAGPASPSPIRLALDNTSASGNLVYQFDGQAASGAKITNFAGVTIQRSNAGAGTVAGQLKSNTRVNELTLLNSTTFDLAGHALAVESSGSIAGYLASHALFSSSLDADTKGITTLVQFHGSDLGLAGSDTTTFLGLTLDAATLVLAPSYYGDINYDGRINADDYILMDRSVAKHLPAFFFNGDFNQNGVVDGTDYMLLDKAFVLSNGSSLSPELLAQRESQFGPDYVSTLLASVPEPSAFACSLSAALYPLVRRRRRSR